MAEPPAAETRLIEAMELSLCEIDVAPVWPLVEAAGERDEAATAALLGKAETLRRLLAGARLASANCRATDLLRLKSAALPLALSSIWPFAQGAVLARALAAHRAGKPSFRVEMRLRRLDGEQVPVIFTSWQEQDAPCTRLRAGIVDISARMRAEEAFNRLHGEIAHAGRISMLGELTASVAHEIRQPLAGIKTYAEAAQRWLARPDPNLEQIGACLANIVLGSDQANEVVARLRSMASSQPQRRGACDLNGLIEETLQFLRHEMSSRQVTVRLDLDPDLPPVDVDRVQVQQVISNLALNAAQAMADAQCWSRILSVRSRRRADAVWIEIEDTGPGIAPADQERLFDGFFTTKANGLGLGLRICRSIVEAHGGSFELRSKYTTGTTFAFSLPVVSEG